MEECLVIFKLLGRILFFGRQKPEWLMIVCGWNLCSPLYEYTTVTRCFMGGNRSGCRAEIVSSSTMQSGEEELLSVRAKYVPQN